MVSLKLLTLGLVLISEAVSQFFIPSFGAVTCGWQYGGQCKRICDSEEYILGRQPCGFGVAVCCSPTLPCLSYGGVCRQRGCFSTFEVPLQFNVRCPFGERGTCCVRRSKRPVTQTTTMTTTTTLVPPVCASRPRFHPVAGRIVGGVPVSSQCQWPWMVSIKLGTTNQIGPHICAGVLVNRNKVLTTSSCVLGRQVVVTVGENNINNLWENGEQTVAVTGVATPNPSPADLGQPLRADDIAILTLESSIPSDGTSCAQPVCLPRNGETVDSNSRCYIAGWGPNALGDGLLHEANVRIMQNALCSFIIGSRTNLPTDKICSHPVIDRTNACQRDNGGMLVCEDGTGTWSLFGLISDNNCNANIPVIYTQVSRHLGWITSNL
ncbi:chymotrypsin-like elastase family member 2A [Haliotis cracherodii]|uniref:chymotrypsin-like elastase family member 2A n=1 Tax=Haliotis cracherodii TaxID=6455 RepID=UPI0039EAA812